MSEIALTVLKVLFLALLWLFILSAVSVIRSDLFGRTASAPGRPTTRAGTARPPPPRPEAAGRAENHASSPLRRVIRPASPPSWPAE